MVLFLGVGLWTRRRARRITRGALSSVPVWSFVLVGGDFGHALGAEVTPRAMLSGGHAEVAV